MTCNNSLFSSLDSYVVTNIKLGDDFLVLEKVKGIVPVSINKIEKKFIHEVFYVPHLNVKIINIGKLLQNKYDLLFYDTCCAIYDKPPSRRLIAKVEVNKKKILPLSLRSSNLPWYLAHTVSGLDES